MSILSTCTKYEAMLSLFISNCEQVFTLRSLYVVVTLALRESFFSSYCIG